MTQTESVARRLSKERRRAFLSRLPNRRGCLAGAVVFALYGALWVPVIGFTGSQWRPVIFGAAGLVLVGSLLVALWRGTALGSKGRSSSKARPGRWE
jgi:hypothetical protein